MSALPPAGESAEAWRTRMATDPTAIVSLADHLLRACGLALRLGNPADPAPLFELQIGLRAIPLSGSGDEPLIRAQQLLDAGAMALSGIAAGCKIAPADIDPMVNELRSTLDRGDETMARHLATQVLAALIQTETLPELTEHPESGIFSSWYDGAMRMRQARWH